MPIVFRGPNGAAASVAAQHSQCNGAWYSHVSGLKVCVSWHMLHLLLQQAAKCTASQCDSAAGVAAQHSQCYGAQPRAQAQGGPPVSAAVTGLLLLQPGKPKPCMRGCAGACTTIVLHSGRIQCLGRPGLVSDLQKLALHAGDCAVRCIGRTGPAQSLDQGPRPGGVPGEQDPVKHSVFAITNAAEAMLCR